MVPLGWGLVKRSLTLRDAALGRWGKMGADVATTCTAKRP